MTPASLLAAERIHRHTPTSRSATSGQGAFCSSLWWPRGDYVDRVITVSRLDARSAQAYLHGKGRANLDGAVSANLDASDIPLSLLNLFLPAKERLSGQISALTVVASGQTRAPDLTASIDLDQPGVTVISPAAAGQNLIETRYGIDSIRSSKITPDGTRRVSSADSGCQ